MIDRYLIFIYFFFLFIHCPCFTRLKHPLPSLQASGVTEELFWGHLLPHSLSRDSCFFISIRLLSVKQSSTLQREVRWQCPPKWYLSSKIHGIASKVTLILILILTEPQISHLFVLFFSRYYIETGFMGREYC